MLDDRAKLLLKTLVERYIADGQPVGSRTLSRSSGLELSPATIRNVMADLEEMGFITSPHTSAGRIPTPLGYRLFVDTLLTVRPLEEQITRRPEPGQAGVHGLLQGDDLSIKPAGFDQAHDRGRIAHRLNQDQSKWQPYHGNDKDKVIPLTPSEEAK